MGGLRNLPACLKATKFGKELTLVKFPSFLFSKLSNLFSCLCLALVNLISPFWFSTFSNCTTLGKGSPVNSCLWLIAICSSTSSVSSSLSVSILSTFVDSICVMHSSWLSSLFSFSLLILSSDWFRTESSLTVTWLSLSSSGLTIV